MILLRKNSLQIYIYILIFSILICFLFVGATGHGFHFNSIDKLYLTFAFLGITIVPFYKSKGIDNTLLKKTILLLSILIAIATFIIGIILLKGNINFNYGDDVSYFFIGFTYLILLFFLFANGVIVSDIINKFRQ